MLAPQRQNHRMGLTLFFLPSEALYGNFHGLSSLRKIPEFSDILLFLILTTKSLRSARLISLGTPQAHTLFLILSAFASGHSCIWLPALSKASPSSRQQHLLNYARPTASLPCIYPSDDWCSLLAVQHSKAHGNSILPSILLNLKVTTDQSFSNLCAYKYPESLVRCSLPVSKFGWRPQVLHF